MWGVGCVGSACARTDQQVHGQMAVCRHVAVAAAMAVAVAVAAAVAVAVAVAAARVCQDARRRLAPCSICWAST